MNARKLEIEIPGAIAAFFPLDDETIKKKVNILLLADLARQGIITYGKAAEILGVDKMALITEMGRMGIPYFDGTVLEVLADAETVSQTIKEQAL